jgi:hypothetical protein
MALHAAFCWFRPFGLDVTDDYVAQRPVAGYGLFETGRGNRRKSSRNLDAGARERKPRAETALQADAALAADRGCFDRFAVGDDDQRYHAALRKIDLIDRGARVIAGGARGQADLLEVRLQQRDRIVW